MPIFFYLFVFKIYLYWGVSASLFITKIVHDYKCTVYLTNSALNPPYNPPSKLLYLLFCIFNNPIANFNVEKVLNRWKALTNSENNIIHI